VDTSALAAARDRKSMAMDDWNPGTTGSREGTSPKRGPSFIEGSIPRTRHMAAIRRELTVPPTAEVTAKFRKKRHQKCLEYAPKSLFIQLNDC
jgi:hypothetical protein